MSFVRFLRALGVVTALVFAWSSTGIAVAVRIASVGFPGEVQVGSVPARGLDAGSVPDSHWRADLQKSIAPTVTSAWHAAAFHAGLATARVVALSDAPAAIDRGSRSAAQPHAPPSALNRPLRI